MNSRIKQHTPLHILLPIAQTEKPKHGRSRHTVGEFPVAVCLSSSHIGVGGPRRGMGSSSEVLAEPPLLQPPGGVPGSMPLGALPGFCASAGCGTCASSWPSSFEVCVGGEHPWRAICHTGINTSSNVEANI